MTEEIEEKQRIKVGLIDRNYPMIVAREQEEKYRRAARMINDTFLKYRQTYSDKDNQDVLAMVAFHYVTVLLDEQERRNFGPIVEGLKDLNNQLDECLKNYELYVL